MHDSALSGLGLSLADRSQGFALGCVIAAVQASRMRLGSFRRRGVLSAGSAADVVAFDPERLRERSTFADPHQYPEGMEWVLVNGKVVIERGEHTGERAGRVLPER